MTYVEAFRHAIQAIINVGADLTSDETRTAVMSLIPKEFHVTHHQN
jgi:hypothetical protein